MKHTVGEPVDYFGCGAEELKRKKLFLFDMDGTIYNEDTVFDGTCQLLEYVENIGGKYVFITNNSSRSVVDYVAKIKRLGIRGEEENFFTSTQATIIYLKKKYPGAKIYCQGTRSLVKELVHAGLHITECVEENIDVVLAGFDTELTGQKLRNTCEILSTQEVAYIATNPDLCCPVSFGYVPDCGSICGIIETATGKRPVYIGKPEPVMIHLAREKFGYSAEETLIIGDRLYTDIAAGLNAGITSVCVLSGEAKEEEIINGDIKPTYTFQDVKELWKAIALPGSREAEN
ncbi:MAG: HAD-IIA family hydrolase [Lachnospiraceae bacterium]|nr:HAD-IIA family hydrolase [Lachnospiraceae bacterium]